MPNTDPTIDLIAEAIGYSPLPETDGQYQQRREREEDAIIDFTFADDGDLVRKAPKAVPEDPIEKRLAREREAAPFIAQAIEIRHGSGKVKV